MTTHEWYPGMPEQRDESADQARDRHEAAVAYDGDPVVAPDRSTVITAGNGLAIGFPPAGELHPAVLGILRFFDYHHLRPELRTVSQPFHDLAHRLAGTLPPDPETTVALRKLREAKDIAVSLVAIGLPR